MPSAILNHVFQSASEYFLVARLLILFYWHLMSFVRKPDSERGREEQNGAPGVEEDDDIEVRSKSNQINFKKISKISLRVLNFA